MWCLKFFQPAKYFFQTLCQFCTRVLQDMDIVITDIDTQVYTKKLQCKPLKFWASAHANFICFQFHNGVNLVLMMGLLEGYYVPLYKFHYNPVGHDEKVLYTCTCRGKV